jgi:DNA-binding NarL/FixJ family response regulator
MTIRLLLVDDHAVLRSGLRQTLEREPDLAVVGEAADAAQALARVHTLRPDVVLLDVIMPRRSGLDVIAELKQVAPASAILMLSAQASTTAVRTALAAGASGYVGKHASDRDLVDAIRRVARGESYVDPGLGARLVVSAAEALTEALSERERDVLYMLAIGYANQEIASRLYISVRTVETHRAHIMRKLGFETRAELVLYALANGLVGAS